MLYTYLSILLLFPFELLAPENDKVFELHTTSEIESIFLYCFYNEVPLLHRFPLLLCLFLAVEIILSNSDVC